MVACCCGSGEHLYMGYLVVLFGGDAVCVCVCRRCRGRPQRWTTRQHTVNNNNNTVYLIVVVVVIFQKEVRITDIDFGRLPFG